MTTSLPTRNAAKPDERMACMEVWGGNREVDRSFALPGLSLQLSSRVFDRQAAGGDIYLVSSCASGRIARWLLADVSGHGAVVAEVAGHLRELLRQYVNVVSQNQLVAEVNREFGRLVEDGGFATAVVCTYFSPNRSLAISNAGHPPPLLLRRREGRWLPLVGGNNAHAGLANTPLGIASEATYSSPRTTLEEGDMLLCYSDAWTESRGRDGRVLGVAGLEQVLNKLQDQGSTHMVRDLHHEVESMDKQGLGADDATILLARVEDTGTTLRDNLLAPFRLFRKAHDKTTFETPLDGRAPRRPSQR